MKIKINYSDSCRTKMFVQTGEIINSNVVEIDDKALSAEERQLLLDTTTASIVNGNTNLESRTLRWESDEYTDDLLGMLRSDRAAYNAAIEVAIAQAREENKTLESYNNNYYHDIGVTVRVGRAEHKYCVAQYCHKTESINAFCGKDESLIGKSRDEIRNIIKNFDYEKSGYSEDEIKDKIVDAVVALRDKYVAEMEKKRKTAEEEENRNKETENAIREWAKAYGSDYLRGLIDENMQYYSVFEKEHAQWSVKKINDRTGLNWQLHTDSDDCYYYDIHSANVSENALAIFRKAKGIEGFHSAYIQFEDKDCENVYQSKYLVAKIKTNISDFQIAIELVD